MKVLMVDDSAEIRERLTAMLGELPEVEIAGQATTVAEAVSAAHLLKPDVMILDLRMPDGNGLDVLYFIEREQIQTRVIVLTNYTYPQFEKRARAAGAFAYLYKPKEFCRVADLVRSLMPASPLSQTEALFSGSEKAVEEPVS